MVGTQYIQNYFQLVIAFIIFFLKFHFNKDIGKVYHHYYYFFISVHSFHILLNHKENFDSHINSMLSLVI